jgi:hypothetical protein
MIGFLIYLLVLYLASAKLSAGSRAFPMAVIVVSLIAVGLKLLTLQFKGLKWLDPSGNMEAGLVEKASEDSDLVCETPPEQEVKLPKPPPVLTVALFLLWLITFAVGIYFIGFLPTMAVWLFIFMAGLSRIKWTKALFLSVCTFLVLYFSFVTLLGTNFPRGILF